MEASFDNSKANIHEKDPNLKPSLTNQEISFINTVIAQSQGNKYFSDFEIRTSNQSFSYRPSNKSLDMLKTSLTDDLGPEIATRALETPQVKRLGVIGLYDGLYQKLVTLPPEQIKVSRLADAERGSIYLIKFGKDGVVVKQFQESQEREISKIAGEAHLGPKTYGPGLEFVEDYLPERNMQNLHPRKIGQLAGELLRGLHDRDIFHTDFSDHLRYDPKDGKLKLIDFGLAFRYDGTSKINDKDLLRVLILATDDSIKNDELFRLLKEEPEKYNTISPEELKARELEAMRKELIPWEKPILKYSAYRLFTKNSYVKALSEGLDYGYQNLR